MIAWIKKSFNTETVITFVLAACFSGLVFVGINTLIQPDKFDPFGEYPVQHVDEGLLEIRIVDEVGTETYLTLPAASVDQHFIHVTGVKCSAPEIKEPYEVEGVVRWQSVEPPGFSLQPFEGSVFRDPGCNTFSFENDVPLEVEEYARQQFAAGREYVIFNINGRETAIDSNGDEGATQTWRTENFVLVP